jgi:tetratricopeptide (TPR) repeat protein
LELAARIEAERPQASLLITRGTALGSRDDIERGLAVAERAKDLLQLSRGFNNLAELVIESGDLAAAFEVYARQRREFGQLGLSAHLVWLDVQEASIAGATGAWDRTLELLDPILARLDAGSTMYLEGDARLTRARIREARGDTHAALADARRGLLAARSAKDPQALIPGLGSTAGLLLHAGRWDEARSLLEEALALSRGLAVPYYTMAPSLLVAVLDLALQNEFLEVFGPHAERDPWTRASVLASGGDLPGAAEAFADLGGRTIEADIRLRAAADLRARGDGTAADEQLQAALAFFRSVGATQRILDAGELLSASA